MTAIGKAASDTLTPMSGCYSNAQSTAQPHFQCPQLLLGTGTQQRGSGQASRRGRAASALCWLTLAGVFLRVGWNNLKREAPRVLQEKLSLEETPAHSSGF